MQDFRVATLYQKETSTQVFSGEYCKILRTVILKNICELLLYLTDFSEQLLFEKAIFQNSLACLTYLFTSNFYFTFVSLNKVVTQSKNLGKTFHVDKESNSRMFRLPLMYVFCYSLVLNKYEHKKLFIIICKQNYAWYKT